MRTTIRTLSFALAFALAAVSYAGPAHRLAAHAGRDHGYNHHQIGARNPRLLSASPPDAARHRPYTLQSKGSFPVR